MRWKVDSTTGDVAYSIRGVSALIDRGKKITVLVPDRNATRVALQMAIHKYGNLIDAQGTVEWQAQLIAAAVQDNARVVFTEPQLQQRLVAAHQAARHQEEPACPNLEHAKARFRHYDDQLMARYGHGLDPSKADRLIAESMARAGISEQEISGALRDLSRHGATNGSLVQEAYCSRVATQAARQVQQTRQARTASQDSHEHSME